MTIHKTVKISCSLPVVPPVASSDESVWQPGHTEAWFRENGFPVYQDVPLEQQEINRNTEDKGHGMQNKSTLPTYEKLFNRLKEQNPNTWQNLRVPDASSGPGKDTEKGRDMCFYVTDIEPYHGDNCHPQYTDNWCPFSVYICSCENKRGRPLLIFKSF